jgi:hypothetical protein
MLQKVEIYQQCLAMENSLLQSYRNLFLTVEVILLTLAVALLTIDKIEYTWIPIAIGLIYCFASVFVFKWGRNRVDYWRDRIFEEIKNTELERIFKVYQPLYIWKIPSLTSPRFWFDFLSPITISMLWISILIIVYL